MSIAFNAPIDCAWKNSWSFSTKPGYACLRLYSVELSASSCLCGCFWFVFPFSSQKVSFNLAFVPFLFCVLASIKLLSWVRSLDSRMHVNEDDLRSKKPLSLRSEDSRKHFMRGLFSFSPSFCIRLSLNFVGLSTYSQGARACSLYSVS